MTATRLSGRCRPDLNTGHCSNLKFDYLRKKKERKQQQKK